jgi:hypothetical protein
VSTNGLDPEGGSERGEHTVILECGAQIGPDSDVLGGFTGLDRDRRGVHSGGIVECRCDLSKTESCVRCARSSGLSRIASQILAMAPSRSLVVWNVALKSLKRRSLVRPGPECRTRDAANPTVEAGPAMQTVPGVIDEYLTTACQSNDVRTFADEKALLTRFAKRYRDKRTVDLIPLDLERWHFRVILCPRSNQI